MKVTVVMSSGKELAFECDDATVQKKLTANGLSSLTLEGVSGLDFLFIKLDNVDAVLYEKEEEAE